MYKYLHIFETRDKFTEMYNDGDKYEEPWTSYVDEDGGVNYNKPDPHKIYAAIDTIRDDGEPEEGELWTRLDTGDFYNFGARYKVRYWDEFAGVERDGYAMNGSKDDYDKMIRFPVYTSPDGQEYTNYAMVYDIHPGKNEYVGIDLQMY